MEEIVSTDAIQDEILADARKKAARMLEEAEEESARTIAAIEGKAISVVEGIMRSSEARSARFRMEMMARFPLERTRMRVVFAEKALREALRVYITALPESRVADLSEAMLALGAPFLAGQDVELSRKGLGESAVRAVAGRALALAASVEFAEDDSMPAAGLVARSRDGMVVLRATMDLVEERLLDEDRGELARALCADLLSADVLRAEALEL
jgi:vacuolar-type H+-ATPase subunit E/Vma4